MKKFFLKSLVMLFACLVWAAGARAEGYRLYIEDFSVTPGETQTVSIILDNDTKGFTGFQAKVFLPEGLTLVETYDEEEEATLAFYLNASRKKSKHDIQYRLQKDGSYMILAGGNGTQTYGGTSGTELVYFQVAVAADFEGPATIRVAETTFTDVDLAGFHFPEETCNVTVKATEPEPIDPDPEEPGEDDSETPGTPDTDLLPSTDISSFSNVLYFNDVEQRAGDFPLELNMKCAEENITAFQCDVYLPEGVEWKYTTDKRGKIIYDLPAFNEDRTDQSYHTITPIAKNADGSFNIIVYSMDKEIILDTDGVLMTLPLTIPDEIEAGEYNIFLRNVVLTSKDLDQTEIEQIVSRLTIPSYIIGDANGDDKINVTDIVYIVSYIRNENPEGFIFDAADVNEDTKVNVTDIVGVIDIIRGAGLDNASSSARRIVQTKAAPKTESNLDIVPFTVVEGQTSAIVQLNMNNPGDEFTAFQCDVLLPEGISWESTVDRRGNVKYTQPVFNAEADRTDATYHEASVGVNKADGSMNIIVYSQDKEIFFEEEGAILDIPLVFDANLAPGIYQVVLKNIVMTRPDNTDIEPANYTFSILVGEPTDKQIALHGNFTTEAVSEFSNVLKNTDVTSIDLTEAVAIADDATIETANPNTLIYLTEGMQIANTENVVASDECESLVLTDGYPFFAPKNFSAQSASYRRTGVNASGWYSCVVPFDAEVPEGAKVEEFGSFNTTSITLLPLQSITANSPFFFKPAGTTFEVTAQNVDIDAMTSATFEVANYKASYETTDEGSITGKYAMKADGTGFGLCGEKAYLVPFRAVLTIENASNARAIDIDRSTPTSIETIADTMRTAEVFDIQGRRVSNATKAGIYVANGRKYIVK